MILFDHVTKRLSGRTILDGLDFEVEQGETFVIVGPSGVGKSVTLKHMVRLLRPDEGEVFVDGDGVSEAAGPDLERLRERFGYLFQGGALLAWMTLEENVGLPLREKTDMGESEIADRVIEVLERVGLKDDRGKHPSEISGGMRKRAGLARAIVRKPRIVLYDEPTSGLDPVSARSIDELIDKMRADLGVTSVVVTHDLQSALSIGTRIGMLHNGKMVELAAPSDFIRSDHEQVRRFLDSQFITTKGKWERTSS